MSWNAWRVIGTALQMGGLALAAYGVAETRESYAPDRKGVVGAARAWLVGILMAARRLALTRVFRRPVHAHVFAAAGAATVGFSASAHAQVAYGGLDPAMSVEERLSILDERSRANRDQVNRLDADARNTGQKLDRLASSLETAKADLDGKVESDLRELATEGLSRQATGLALTAIGTVIAAIG